MAYREKHIKNKIKKIQKKRPALLRLRLLFSSILLFFLIFYFVFFSQAMKINNVLVLGNSSIERNKLANFIQESSSFRIINFLGRQMTLNNIFLIDTNKIAKEAESAFPAIYKISIKKRMFQTLEVKVIERQPVGIFCNGADLDKCFSIDGNGIIFESINHENFSDKLIFQLNYNLPNIDLNKQIIDPRVISEIIDIKNVLEDNSVYKISSVTIFNPQKIICFTNGGWKIYLNATDNNSGKSESLKLKLLLDGGLLNEKKQNLKYIDLRPKEKAIICDNAECQNRPN